MDKAKSSEPSTPNNLSDEAIAQSLGFPTPEQQKEYDQTQQRIQQKRDRFYGQPTVRPIDYAKLSDDGKVHREKVAGKLTSTQPAISRLDSILSRVTAFRQPMRSQTLPFAEAQLIVKAIYENALAGRERKPYWTQESFNIVDDVTRYFIGDPTGPIPLTKSLYVYGPVGVGKTYLFRMMSILCEVVPIPEMRFSMVSTKRLLRAISDTKSLKPLARIEKGNWLIDDLAEEKKIVRVYGDEENPIDHLITTCYEAFVDNGKKTHFTSNRQPDEIEPRYGTRAYDRFSEMVEPIYFPGESLRTDPNLLTANP
ncbi:hypothetical protein [Spirosoma spitsbergense]|uniref:hypothetical protein n=1 Tax=Spirosoma spitsbergense TaxID=431554 RepID=UPI0003644517|nr:hypothetical protein [Spirosoma spitsbergense]